MERYSINRWRFGLGLWGEIGTAIRGGGAGLVRRIRQEARGCRETRPYIAEGWAIAHSHMCIRGVGAGLEGRLGQGAGGYRETRPYVSVEAVAIGVC